jgi:serine/threonine-protein kinase
VDKLERLLGGQQISGKTLEHFYWLGRACEELGKTSEAIDRFRKVLTERYGYEDVEQRIARLSAGSAAPEAPTQALPPAQPAAPAPSAAPAAGESASPIQLGELLGKGLLGTTHKGVDTRNQSPVIIKLLRQDLIQNQSILQQFIAEAKLARNLEHPSLVRLLGLIQVQGTRAAVTEYVEGFSLSAFLERNKRVSVKQGMDLLSTLAAAVSYAHERKLLHRDLKLTDILIGAGGKLKITGFGMGALRVAQLGRADGYPAPEFLSGAEIGPRSDIYSLGAVIFHALTGINPASEEASANGAPPLRQLCPDASATFEQVLARCLSNDPADRFASAQEVIAALQATPG